MNPYMKQILVPTAIGGTVGSGLGYYGARKRKEGKLKAALKGGLALGSVGAIIGSQNAAEAYTNDYFKNFSKGFDEQWSRARGGYGGYHNAAQHGGVSLEEALSHIGAHKKMKTKAEVKKVFRDAAMRNHPDIGGDAEKMKRINASWAKIKDDPWFHKLAMEFLEKKAGAIPGPGIKSGLFSRNGIAQAAAKTHPLPTSGMKMAPTRISGPGAGSMPIP